MIINSKITTLTLGLLLFSKLSFSQCAVTAPPDVAISCGSSTTIVAPSNPVTYSVSTSSCPAVAITGTNAFPTTCDDCVTGQIPIGFPFNFYGNVYTDAVIQSNGLLGFGPFTFTGFSSFAIPAGGAPNNYIAGFFADIDIRYGGTITYQTVGVAPNRQFVVSYNNCVPYNMGSGAGTGTVSFQIILNENGSFQTEVSQLSANWNASTSGALATQGAENIDGTYAFPVPGRNATDWPGITPAELDCQLFNPIPCTFIRWEVGGTQVSTNASYTVSPTSTTTYTGVWNCGGSLCYDNTIVSLSTSLTMGSATNNTNCAAPNGSVGFTTIGFADGTYTLNYSLNGTPTSTSVTVASNAFTLLNLNGGTYTNFSISSGGCNAVAAGTATITNPSSPITTGVTICQGSPAVSLTSSVCGVSGTTIAQGAVFNSGALTATDPTWNRNSGGTTCNGTAGTSNYYDVYSFTVSTPGSYTFVGCFPTIDAHASLYQNAFNGADPCGTAGNFIVANDDGSSVCSMDPSLTATLSTGVTYYIISTTFSSSVTDTYSWTFTGPAGATIEGGASGSVLEWYTTSSGGSSIGTGTPFNPVGVAGSGLSNTNTPGTYTYYAACSSTPTCRTATPFIITANSVVPTSISGTGTVCHGSSVVLTQVGGTLAPGAVWEWYSGSCGGTFLGNGNSIVVTPTATTTYYVRASAGTSCSATACISGTVTLPAAGSTLSNNNETATCLVNQNGYIHFYHSSGRFLGSVNSLGQNLGNVTMTSYTGAPVNVSACNPPIYVTAAMGRHWVITPQFQPATPVDVLLPFDNTEYLALQAAASINANAYDDLLSIADLKLSKYSGPLNVDANGNNNCPAAGGNGGTTIHGLSTSGTVSSVIGGFSATAQYGRFSIPGFSEFWLHGSSALSPLPVELITFSANCENQSNIKLLWSTATENNNDHFVIEKSFGDGSWAEIAQVQGAGNSQNIINYSFIDENSSRGTSYYRLIQVDYDGNETVYDIRSVNCSSEHASIVAYPNPAQNNLTVEVSTSSFIGETVLSVTDVSGKLIIQKEINLEEGQTMIPLNTTDLSTGSYIITLNNASEQFSPIKVIIQK